MAENSKIDFNQLALDIKQWGKQLGFAQVGITDTDVSEHIQSYRDWLSRGYHGQMSFMQRNQQLREDPAQLHPGTLRIISVRMNYLINDAGFAATLKDPNRAYVSRYALGRDYHKVLRKRLKKLAEKIKTVCQQLDYRPFVDSAPIMERPIAEKAGLGWTGKHTLLIHPNEGSWFFLGELLVNLPLPTDSAIKPQCGSCVACMTLCPTGAITDAYQVDARRCISYLTIENPGPIAEEFRPLMGNRIYGCDDCQLACPYNRQSQLGEETDFLPRHELDKATLLSLFAWDEATFLRKTVGSPIRRIGHERWQRNIAVALGNVPASISVIQALEDARPQASELVKEHIDWALKQHYNQLSKITRQTKRLIRIVEKGLTRDA